MPHHLHVDTDALRATRLAIEAVCASLQQPRALDPEALAVVAAVPTGAALIAEHDRLVAAVQRTARELNELDVVVRAAAEALDDAEWRAVRALAGGDR